MARKSKKDLIDTTPDVILRRSDAIQYWLQQIDIPTPTSNDYKRLKVLDKMIIKIIRNVLDDGHPASATWLFENGWGKNTEGADVSAGDVGYEIDFGVSTNKKYDETESETDTIS